MPDAPPPAGPVGGTGPLLLLDGMSLAFRAYFALPTDLATSDGRVTNALHGFVAMLVNLVRDHRPSALAIAFDLPGGTFRDELVEAYKGGRAETPEELVPQFEMIRAVAGALAVPVVAAEGYEADDVIATLATEARDRGHDVVVVTGDRDAFQLVEDPHVRVLYNRRGVSDYALYDEAGIAERTGVRPSDYPLLAALRGDPSDNLPGVPGVGEKTAAKLVNQYGTADALFAHVDELTPKLRENLAAHEGRVRANLAVIPLVRTVPLALDADQLTLGGWEEEEARQVFAAFELRTLWARCASLLRDGLLGDGRAGDDLLGADEPGTAPPAWAARPEVEASTAGSAAADIEAVVARARQTTGNVALVARWSGDPGRSALAALLLTAEASDPDQPACPVTALRGDALEMATGPLAAAFGGGVGVVAHDAKEVMRSLLPVGVDVRSLVMDTAVAAYLLDPSVDRYRLADLARTWLGVPIAEAPAGGGQEALDLGSGPAFEDEGAAETGALAAGGLPAWLVDAAREAGALARLRHPLTAALAERGMTELHDDVERPLVRVLARMEVTGICVDRHVLTAIADELAAECGELEARIQHEVGVEFNVNSVPQLRDVLYGKLGLRPGRRTKTGYSTDARTLEQLRDQHPVVGLLLRYREADKLRSTYGTNLAAEVADDGRIHATFRQTVARTGRLSSDRPNLHNIPVRTPEGRRFREAFVPSPGRRLLVADYDQIELRAIAHLSGDPGLTAAFAAGEDIHRTVAARVFGVPRDEVTPEQRSTAKMVSYGLAYGMEAFGLAQRLNVPVDEAQAILLSFFEAFPAVQSHMERTVAEAERTGYTTTVFGRRRPLPDLHSSNRQLREAARRQAMNAGIQGLAADLFKVALDRLDAGLEAGGHRSDLVLQVHDEVLVDVEPDEADEVATLTEEALVGAAELSVPLRVAMAFGSSWAEAKGG